MKVGETEIPDSILNIDKVNIFHARDVHAASLDFHLAAFTGDAFHGDGDIRAFWTAK